MAFGVGEGIDDGGIGGQQARVGARIVPKIAIAVPLRALRVEAFDE